MIAKKIADLGLVLPAPFAVPAGVVLPFRQVRVVGKTAYVSGHIPQADTGEITGPFGKVGRDLSVEEGYEAAKKVALGILASLERELGDLDRIDCWASLFGMVNSAEDFNQFPAVVNGCSDLILEVFGQDVGGHARSAIGIAGLPFDAPVEIEAVVQLK